MHLHRIPLALQLDLLAAGVRGVVFGSVARALFCCPTRPGPTGFHNGLRIHAKAPSWRRSSYKGSILSSAPSTKAPNQTKH